MYVKARYLVDAIRSGSRTHLVLAAATEAASLAAGGGSRRSASRSSSRRRARSRRTGKTRPGSRSTRSRTASVEYLRGDWQPALARLDQVCASLAAVRRWNANASVFAIYSLVYMGDLREVKARTLRLLADAEQRGDLYTSVNLRASHPIAAWLGSDDVAGARRHLHDSMLDWPKTAFLVQHWQNMLWEAEVELYVGDGAAAWDRLQRDTRALRRSRMFSVQLIAILTHFVRGRSAVASAGALGRGRSRKRASPRRTASSRCWRT